MKRRDLIKYLSIAPLSGAVVGSGVPFRANSATIAKPKRDLINELGIRRFINASGPYTAISASLMHNEVMEAINSSSKGFVMYGEVQDKVGAKIAAICHSEAAMVTAGCSSALLLGTAAALTGMNRNKVAQLPDVENFDKNEVIVQKSHNYGYIHVLNNTGIKKVLVETSKELEKAISSKTALMYFLNDHTPDGKIKHQEWLAIAKKHNIPTIIDIAADVPPVENLWKFNDMGFDMVCVSGGKAIRGPQSTGILMGRKHLVAAARLSAPPDNQNIGRGMKVNKEEIFGLYAALERYVNQDHNKEWKTWESQVAVIDNAVKKIKGVTTEIVIPPIHNRTPNLSIFWDSASINLTTKQMTEKLREGSPSIEVGVRSASVPSQSGALNITVWMLQPGEEKIVAKRIQEELLKASAS